MNRIFKVSTLLAFSIVFFAIDAIQQKISIGGSKYQQCHDKCKHLDQAHGRVSSSQSAAMEESYLRCMNSCT